MSSIQPVTMRRSFDQFLATSIGTSNARTLLNGGNVLNSPDSVKAILGVTPFIIPQTLTAAQAIAALVEMDAPSVQWKPKQVLVGPVCGGLGTFGAATHPLYKEFPCFTKINTTGVKQLQAYATALQTNGSSTAAYNTSAPLIGVDIDYSLDSIPDNILERFYQCAPIASISTFTGTAAATVAGPSIQISTGKTSADGSFGGYLEMIQGMFTPGVSTVNNTLAGFMSFFSSDIITPEPLTVRMHPIVQGTTSPLAALAIQTNIRENVHRKIKASSLINTSATFDIAPTASGNFVAGIGYTQPP